MDLLIQLILSTGTVLAAAVIAIIIGSRKGLADVEARTDAEMTRLVDALEKRIAVLEHSLAEAKQKAEAQEQEITSLRAEIVKLRTDLMLERAITARLTGGAQ